MSSISKTYSPRSSISAAEVLPNCRFGPPSCRHSHQRILQHAHTEESASSERRQPSDLCLLFGTHQHPMTKSASCMQFIGKDKAQA